MLDHEELGEGAFACNISRTTHDMHMWAGAYLDRSAMTARRSLAGDACAGPRAERAGVSHTFVASAPACTGALIFPAAAFLGLEVRLAGALVSAPALLAAPRLLLPAAPSASVSCCAGGSTSDDAVTSGAESPASGSAFVPLCRLADARLRACCGIVDLLFISRTRRCPATLTTFA